MIIKNAAGNVKSEAVVLQDYFGRKEGQNLQDFMAEVKKLDPKDKSELATLAAKELGYTVE